MPATAFTLLPARIILPVLACGNTALLPAVTYSSQPRTFPKTSPKLSVSSRRFFSPTIRANMTSEASPLVAKHDASNCIFCKILVGTMPSYKIFETEHTLSFLDAFPMTPGHALLIPKCHYPFLEDMPPEAVAEVARELPRLSKAVREAVGADGVNVVQNNGSVAGQIVFHVHFHVIPRVGGDGLLKFGGSGPMINPEEGKAMQAKIVGSQGPTSPL